MVRVECFHTAPAAMLDELHAFCASAFGPEFSLDDWQHALGGIHCVAYAGTRTVAHAAVVERTLYVGERPVRTGYVEAVATDPAVQGRGHGTAVMTAIGALVEREYEMGALSTGEHHFYERLGWERWQGPTFVRTGEEVRRSADEDDGIMFLRTAAFPDVDPTAPITCEARPGDDW